MSNSPDSAGSAEAAVAKEGRAVEENVASARGDEEAPHASAAAAAAEGNDAKAEQERRQDDGVPGLFNEDGVSARPTLRAMEAKLALYQAELAGIDESLKELLAYDEENVDALDALEAKQQATTKKIQVLSGLLQRCRAREAGVCNSVAGAAQAGASSDINASVSAVIAAATAAAQAAQAAVAVRTSVDKQINIPSDLPKWDSSAKNTSVYEFIRKFENVLSTARITKDHWPIVLRRACMESANDDFWVEANIVKRQLDWDHARAVFIDRFRQRHLELEWEQEYQNIAQRPGESVAQFGNRFQQLANKLLLVQSGQQQLVRLQRVFDQTLSGLTQHALVDLA